MEPEKVNLLKPKITKTMIFESENWIIERSKVIGEDLVYEYKFNYRGFDEDEPWSYSSNDLEELQDLITIVLNACD